MLAVVVVVMFGTANAPILIADLFIVSALSVASEMMAVCNR